MRDTFIEWLILINIITFVIYALDKYKAVHHLWRIPEKTLIFLAIIGGSPAAILAMYTIRQGILNSHWVYQLYLLFR